MFPIIYFCNVSNELLNNAYLKSPPPIKCICFLYFSILWYFLWNVRSLQLKIQNVMINIKQVKLLLIPNRYRFSLHQNLNQNSRWGGTITFCWHFLNDLQHGNLPFFKSCYTFYKHLFLFIYFITDTSGSMSIPQTPLRLPWLRLDTN